jgi:hypothetical protein
MLVLNVFEQIRLVTTAAGEWHVSRTIIQWFRLIIVLFIYWPTTTAWSLQFGVSWTNSSRSNIQDIIIYVIPYRRYSISITLMHWLMLLEIIAAFSGKHSRPLSTNAHFLNVKTVYDLDIWNKTKLCPCLEFFPAEKKECYLMEETGVVLFCV